MTRPDGWQRRWRWRWRAKAGRSIGRCCGSRTGRWSTLVATTLIVLMSMVSVGTRSTIPAAAHGAHSPRIAQGDGLRWASLGDSYAAGEGLEHPSRDDIPVYGSDERVTGSGQTSHRCQRALVRDDDQYPSSAWGAQVAWDRAGPFAFVACTGAITDDLFPAPAGRLQAGQREQAMFFSGRQRFDVVTLSFGGNNIGFADIITGCTGFSAEGAGAAAAGGGVVAPAGAVATWAVVPWVGCTMSVDEMRARIDALANPASLDGALPACNDLGDDTSTAVHWDDDGLAYGRITLPELYDVIGRCMAAPGGTVVVMGYPQLVEESGRWGRLEGNRCHRIRRADAGKLREAAAHLNYRIRQAVEHADATTPARFVFVDPNHFWEGGSLDLSEPTREERENPANRHALCGGGEDWLNGLTVGVEGDGAWRRLRSFHPNQRGQNAMATAAKTIPFEPASEITLNPAEGTVVLPPETCNEMHQYLLPDNELPLRLENGHAPIRAVDQYPPTVVLSDHRNALTVSDLDGDGSDEVLAIVGCATGGSGAWDEIAAFNALMEPVGIVPMGEAIDPQWEFVIDSLEIVDRTIVVRYRGGEHDEALCCGTRIITDHIVYRDGRFERTDREEVSALTWINDFIDAVNAGDRDRAGDLATAEAVASGLSLVASGGPLAPCDETVAVSPFGGDARYCFARQPDISHEIVAEPTGDATWQVVGITSYGGE